MIKIHIKHSSWCQHINGKMSNAYQVNTQHQIAMNYWCPAHFPSNNVDNHIEKNSVHVINRKTVLYE